ncbi:MAG TPA: hypothetical protein VJM50_21645 [Pyrinomonadaceae bacterium]|nr:hypothetical protein [Pyrinomonadaceae bacterium]
MKRISKLSVIAVAAFLLLGSLPVRAVERPFALNGRGGSTFITDEAGNPIGANVTSSGTATHLGLWTSTGKVNFTPDPVTGRLLSSGSGALIAANGDELKFEFNGSLEVNPDGTGTDTGVFRFIGGTGRFVAASGTVDAVVVINLLTGAFELTMVGTVDY